MARRRGRSADTIDIANSTPDFFDFSDELLRPVAVPSTPVTRLDEFLGDALPFDRRRFSFDEVERYTLTTGDRTGGKVTGLSRESVAFGDPSTVAICHRRKERREVLHAFKRTRGRGGARRRSWRSDIKC